MSFLENYGIFLFSSSCLPLHRLCPTLHQVARPRKYHLPGPLDGSLYATIAKSPRSPNLPSVVLSPPAEFRESRFSGSTQSLQVLPSYERPSISPTPSAATLRNERSSSIASTAADSVHFQRAYSTPPQERVDSRYLPINHKSPASINHHQQPHQQQTLHRHPQRSTPQQFVQEIRIVEEFQRPETTEAAKRGGKSTNTIFGGNARDSLTLSMDSGISGSDRQHRQQQQQQQVHKSKYTRCNSGAEVRRVKRPTRIFCKATAGAVTRDALNDQTCWRVRVKMAKETGESELFCSSSWGFLISLSISVSVSFHFVTRNFFYFLIST